MTEDKARSRALDGYLVAAVRTGDGKAADLLVRRWQSRLIAHGWRLTGDADLAREAVQDGWVEILRGIGRLRDEAAFPAWAYRIVTRRCARRIRGRQHDRALAAAVAAEPVAAWVEAEAGDPPALLRLKRAMADLPAEQRATVALFHLEDMSVAETAIALNVPAGTVKTRLMHARRKLRAALEGET